MTEFDFKFTKPSFIWRLWEKLKTMSPSVKTLAILAFIIYKTFKLILSRKKQENETQYYKNYTSAKDTEEHAEDCAIHPFKIHVQKEFLTDLKVRLSRSRFEELSKGFHLHYFLDLIKYWQSQYDWRKQEEELNIYPQFMTKIEGLDVHFLHIKEPHLEESKVKVIPILLIHGWPVSCAYFHKVIPLLTKDCTAYSYRFEVICPSIPGFGFSQAPKYEGFNTRDAARIFLTLMDRLGYSRFYIQGSGWGAVIASLMGRYYPSRVKGLHVNMCFSVPRSFDSFIKITLMAIFPFLATSMEYKTIFPLKKKLRTLYEETGYVHLQAVKPNTLGFAMADSPVGIAAYILEKLAFSTNTDCFLENGLLEKFGMDDLLTLITICWVNKNFSPSVQFCNESLKDLFNYTHERLPLTVPVGVAVFPNEFFMLPKMLMENQLYDLISYTIMPRGGHFAAMEEPQILVEDVRNFLKLVEERRPYDP